MQKNKDFIWSSFLHTPECLAKHRQARFNEDIKDRLIKLLKIKTPADLIEIGCGPGTLSYKLHCWHPGLHVTAFDADRAFIKYANHHYQGPQYIWGDAQNFTTQKKYDYVISHTIMEYMDETCFFNANRRLLKPNGTSIIISNAKSIQFDNYLLFPQINELNTFLTFCKHNSNKLINKVLQKQNVEYSEFVDRFNRNGFNIISQNYLSCENVPQNHSVDEIQDTIEMYREIQKSTFITAWNRCIDIPKEFSYNRILQSIEDYYDKITRSQLTGWPATVDILRITRAKIASAHSYV